MQFRIQKLWEDNPKGKQNVARFLGYPIYPLQRVPVSFMYGVLGNRIPGIR
jgi:hypothetical protein